MHAQGLTQSDVASVREWCDDQSFLATKILEGVRELDVANGDDTSGRPVVVLRVGAPVEARLLEPLEVARVEASFT